MSKKWYRWTIGNDLAGKRWMKDGEYLLRCTICFKESYHNVAVMLCDNPECQTAIAIIGEITGAMLLEDNDGAWYASAGDDGRDGEWWEDSKKFNKDTAEPTTLGA